MSRTVRMDQTLSDEDRKYLRSTGAVGQARERQLDQMFPPDPEALVAFNDRERLYYAELHDRTGATSALTAQMNENAELRRRLAELEAANSAAPDYTDRRWTKAALESEVDRVNAEDSEANLAKGTKEEMVAALTAYFAD